MRGRSYEAAIQRARSGSRITQTPWFVGGIPSGRWVASMYGVPYAVTLVTKVLPFDTARCVPGEANRVTT
jgi:hypothetical protein